MRRKEAKSLRITNGVIVYLGKSRELPKKLLELMREFSKLTRYTFKIHVNQLYFCISTRRKKGTF